MAWLKARARDLAFFTVFAMTLFNCTIPKASCYAPERTMNPSDGEATAPSQDELREMSCACASAPVPGDDCAEDLWDTRELADDAGCSTELDALLFCVEDGEACDEDGGEWACDADEAAWRACLWGERGTDERPVLSEREIAAGRPAAR